MYNSALFFGSYRAVVALMHIKGKVKHTYLKQNPHTTVIVPFRRRIKKPVAEGIDVVAQAVFFVQEIIHTGKKLHL